MVKQTLVSSSAPEVDIHFDWLLCYLFGSIMFGDAIGLKYGPNSSSL